MKSARLLSMAQGFAEAAADCLRPVGNLRDDEARQTARASLQGARSRAASALLRIVDAVGLRLGCRRRAFVMHRALARDGRPNRLCFGIARAPGPGSRRAALRGHVWVEGVAAPGGDGGGYLFTVRPGDPDHNGWRRG
jgi:hypothetical protein